MLRTILATMLYLGWKDYKTLFVLRWESFTDFIFTHLWHRRHVFNLVYFEGSRTKCTYCGKTVEDVTRKKQSYRFLFALLFLSTLTHAAHFDTTSVKRFTYDSIGVVRVFTESTDCGKPRFPCLLRIEDGLGQGESVNAVGGPEDTLKLECPFRRALLPANTNQATLTFYDPQGKPTDFKTVQMGFSDPKPGSVARRRTSHAQNPSQAPWRSLAAFWVNGRVKP